MPTDPSAPEPTAPSKRRTAASVALLIACALVPYLGTLGHGFVNLDDPQTIINLGLLRHLDWSTLPAFFAPDLYPGLPEYMPLKNLSYAVDEALFGRSPTAYRPEQLLWYVLSVLALWAWLRRLLGELARQGRVPGGAAAADTAALATSVLFALHPVHVESVTWLSGRKDVLSGCFVPLSLLCAAGFEGLRSPRGARWLVGSLLAAVLALLSKPTAVVLPALVVLQDLLRTPRERWLRLPLGPRAPLYAGLALITGAFAWLYVDLTRPYAAATSGIEWRLYDGPTPLRWAAQLASFLRLSLWPSGLTPVVPVELLPAEPLSAAALSSSLVALALVAASVYLVWRRHVLGLALGLFLIPLAPIVIAPPWGQYVAGRYLFHAVAGPLLAVVLGAVWWVSRRPPLAKPALAALVLAGLALAASTASYNRLWRDGYTLWTGALEVHPRFTRFHQLAAGAAIEEGRPDDAIPVLARCVEIDPQYAPCAAMLGALVGAVHPEAGERVLRAALPGDRGGEAHLELARLLERTGRAREGLALLERWMNGRSVSPALVEALARLSLRIGDLARAERYVRAHLDAVRMTHGAAPPPTQLWLDLARAKGDPQLAARVRQAAATGRADRFAEALLR